MSDTKAEFDRDKKIDPGQLDVEAVQQADLFYKWAERAIKARGKCDRLEAHAEMLEAKMQMDARANPAKFGIDHPTEGAIKASVRVHPKYTRAYDEYLAARQWSELLARRVAAMEMKKRMLEVLITLHGQQYFAGPSVPRNIIDAWRKHSVGQSEEVAETQRGKARRVRRDND